MIVKELIKRLMKLPQEAEVVFSESEWCAECNYDGMEHYHEVYDVSFKELGTYPNDRVYKNVVVIT